MSGKSPLELLNIVPMLPEHREELAADTLDLLRRGCINRTAFILTLVPEGNPPANASNSSAPHSAKPTCRSES